MDEEQNRKKEQQNKRIIPMNELDYQFLLKDPEWSKNVPDELKDRLAEVIIRDGKDVDGNIIAKVEFKHNLYELIAFYKKDMRLGYLNQRETELCVHYIDVASDSLALDMFRSFIRALSRAITIMEVSQSKGGFLRKLDNTIISGESKTELEPEKSSFPFKRGK